MAFAAVQGCEGTLRTGLSTAYPREATQGCEAEAINGGAYAMTGHAQCRRLRCLQVFLQTECLLSL